MPVKFEILQAQVMSLSKTERLQLLETLVKSVDSDVDLEEYWETVADARDAEIDGGRCKGIPLEDAMVRVRAKLAG